jgi:hypothetical protein
LIIDPGYEMEGNFMGDPDAKRLGTLPNANGTLTRLAYAHAKASGLT